MFHEMTKYLTKPDIYTLSTNKFWDDEHISKGMLEAHLNPELDAASRKADFLDQSVRWIATIAPPAQYPHLLDLGCRPGLYAERFHQAGYSVTGVDFSKRSIAYAKEQTLRNKTNITYHYQNYLTIEYTEQFDVVTIIYCDYAALSAKDRLTLLGKVYQVLKPGGKFILDVFTPVMRREEGHSWQYCEAGGFWSEKPYLCLEAVYQYEEDRTELRQFIVQTEESVNCYHIWDHYFTSTSLKSEIESAGFRADEFYGDVAGKEFSDNGDTICGVFSKTVELSKCN